MKIVKKAGKTFLTFSPADIKALNKRAQSQFSGDPDIYQQMGAPGVEDQYGDEPEAIPPADLGGGSAPDPLGGAGGPPGEGGGGSLLSDVEAVFAKHNKQLSPEMTTLLEHAEKDVSPNDIDGMTPKDETPPMAPSGGETDTPVTPPPTAPQPTSSPAAGQPPAFASALGSQIKIANGKARIQLSKKEWSVVGKKAGWIK